MTVVTEKLKYTLEDYNHNSELSLVEFLYLFLTVLNLKYNTYKNEEFICDTYRSRSLGDITAICNGYNYDVTKEKVKEVLLDFGENMVGHYCGDISKRIYQHIKVQPGWRQASENDSLDEYGDNITYKSEDKNKELLKNSKFITYE